MNSNASGESGHVDADVLVLVEDPLVLASVRRVVAAIDQSADEGPQPVSRQQWNRASAVVLDIAHAKACSSRNPRRSRVFVVGDSEPTLDEWKYATSIGAQAVFTLPADENALVAVLGEYSGSRGEGTVVAVVGACGGAGATVSAAAIALASAARRVPTMLVDVDALGCGADVVLGVEHIPGVRWAALTVEGGRLSAESLRDALPARGKYLRVLSCSRGEIGGPSVTALGAVLDAGRRSGGLVVCDVSGCRGPEGQAVVEASDAVVMVVPATVAACVAAEKVGMWAAQHNSNVGLLVRGPAPGGLRGADVANMLGLPLIAVIRGHRSLASMLERGGLELRRKCALTLGADAVLDRLAAGSRSWSAAA